MGRELKDKIAFSIDPKLLKRVDEMVDNVTVRSRSHAIDILLRKAFGEDKVRSAFVFAGGEKSAKYGIPKCMVEVNDKPLLQHAIEWLEKNGVEEVTIATGKFKDQIESYFKNGEEFGVKIDYVAEFEPLGTAGALNNAGVRFKTTFVAMNGDVACDFSLEKIVEFHKRSKAVATMALTEVESASKYGAVELEGEKITGFVEKPKEGKEPSKLVNAGVYVCEPSIVGFTPEKGMLEKDVFPLLAKKKLLNGFVFSGQWLEASSEKE
ncbi:nucleotidyltransferase family protein [Candidatus Micrarchaeota archaeon]|nr:nucleotidyltransferase family protein [Candidatus Micrarchaeota archaeon]